MIRQNIKPTPGLLFLIQSALILATPALIVYGLSQRLLSSSILPKSANWYLKPILGLLSLFALPICFTAQVLYKKYHQKRRAEALGARLIHTPGGWPGNFWLLKKNLEWSQTGYPGDGLKELLDDNNNIFNIRPLFEDIIVTSEPHHIKTILSTDFNNYVKGDVFKSACKSVLGSGIFNADGDMWKFHRSMTRPFFNRDRISHFELFDRHAEQIIRLMKSRLREGYAVDFQDAMSRFTLDSATEFLFGFSVHSMSNGIPYPHHAPSHLTLTPPSSIGAPKEIRNPSADAFAHSFLDCQFQVTQRVRMGWLWPVTEIFKDRTEESMRVVNAFIDPIVRDAISKNKDSVGWNKGTEQHEGEKFDREVGDDETLLDHLVRCSTDEKLLKEETTNILIAGRDTTAATLTFMFFFLATNPDVTSRLRAEIMEHVGPTRMPTYDDIKVMKYLRAVINETLRLYPVVPFNTRCSVGEATWPSMIPGSKPYYIPADTRIAYSVFLMHRRKDLWGPDAEEFDPDRFLDDRLKKYLLPNNFIFLPFNAGPRICLGQQFAYNEISFITIRLLQQFTSLALDRSSQPPDSLPPDHWADELSLGHVRKAKDGLYPKLHLTMYNEGGLWLKMDESTEGKAE